MVYLEVTPQIQSEYYKRYAKTRRLESATSTKYEHELSYFKATKVDFTSQNLIFL